MYEYKKTIFVVSVIILILIDQISKYIIRVKGGFYICNKGVAFGMNVPSTIIYFVIILFIFLSVISNYKCQISNQAQNQKSKNFVIWIWDLIWHWKFDIGNYRKIYLPSALIIGGGLSNIIDRLTYGCVIDFIDLKYWPVFNLADFCITIGAISFLMKKSNIKNQNDNVKLKND